jgi:hypothetical protein
LKQDFLTVWIIGSFLPFALDTLNDAFKSVLPSKKKKKGGAASGNSPVE